MSFFLDYTRTEISVNGSNATEDFLLTTVSNDSFVWIDVPNVPGFLGNKYAFIRNTYTGDQTINTDQLFFAMGYGDPDTSADFVDMCTVGFARAGAEVYFNTGDDDYNGVVTLYVAQIPSRA